MFAGFITAVPLQDSTELGAGVERRERPRPLRPREGTLRSIFAAFIRTIHVPIQIVIQAVSAIFDPQGSGVLTGPQQHENQG